MIAPWDAHGWMPTGALGPSLSLDTAFTLVPPLLISAFTQRQLWSNWLHPMARREPVGVRRDPTTGALTLALVPSSHDLTVYANQPLVDRQLSANMQRLNEKLTNIALPIVGAAVVAATIASLVEAAKEPAKAPKIGK